MIRIFNLVFFLFLTIQAISQTDMAKKTIEVTYVKAFKNYKDTTQTAPRILKNLEYQLLFNAKEARFEYISSMSNDGDNTNRRFIGKGGGKGIYYNNLSNNISLRKAEYFEQTFFIKLNSSKFDWKLHKNKTKKILGYDCFLATGYYEEKDGIKNRTISQKVTAWYTPSLPVPFGPAGHEGLPGLVLESYRGSFLFIANDIKIDKKEKKIQFINPNQNKILTEEEFLEVLFKNLMKLKNNN